MKKLQLIIATLGALIGVTGAYASTRHHKSMGDGVIYNWYIGSGQLAFSATIAVARSVCPDPGVELCLMGTASALQMVPVTLTRP